MQGGQNFILHQQAQHQTTSRAVSHTAVSSTTPSENDDEGIGSSLADLDSLTDLLPMMAPDLVRKKILVFPITSTALKSFHEFLFIHNIFL